MKFKNCPFCNASAPEDLIDSLYPSGLYYRREIGGYFSYWSFSDEERLSTDKPMYKYVCHYCGVEMTGHTQKEVLYKWNTRPQ